MPRNFYLCYNNLDGCCKVTEIHGFERSSSRKELTNEEWLHALYVSCNGDVRDINRLIVFSHSKKENKGVFTPKAFSEWLVKRGEALSELSYEHMTLYTCCLSDEFFKELEDYSKKKLEEKQKEYERESRRGVL